MCDTKPKVVLCWDQCNPLILGSPLQWRWQRASIGHFVFLFWFMVWRMRASLFFCWYFQCLAGLTCWKKWPVLMGKWHKNILKKAKWPKITFRGPIRIPEVSFFGVLGASLYWKVVLEFWFGHPKCHFWYSQNGQNSDFGGIKNGTSGAPSKILRPLFNTN